MKAHRIPLSIFSFLRNNQLVKPKRNPIAAVIVFLALAALLPTQRLHRDGVELSTKTTWKAWQTDLSGAARKDLATVSIPDCPCPSGSCEESCPYGEVSTPDRGIDKFFILTQVVTGKTQTSYQSTL